MPTDQLVLLIVCIALAVVAVLAGVIGWRRSQRPTRLVAGIAWALVPIGLYLSGLADLVWQGIQGVIAWGAAVPGTPTGVAGLIMIGVGVLTAIVVGVVARRRGPQTPSGRDAAAPAAVGRPTPASSENREPAFTTPPASPGSGNPKLPPAMPQDAGGRGRRGRQPQKASGDQDMDEIEAILKSRGIE